MCQLILSPIALKPFSFQKEREGGVGGYRGYTGRNPGEIGAREIQQAGEKRAGSGLVLKGGEEGEIGENYSKLYTGIITFRTQT